MFLEQLPEYNLLIIAILFNSARFENQRWIRARKNGLMGASRTFGTFIDLTGFLSLIFSIAFLGAYFFDNGIILTCYLVGILFVSSIIVMMAIRFVVRSEHPLIWLVGTLLIWPLGIFLFSKTTWFGLYL